MDYRVSSSAMIKPTTPSTANAASVISQRNALSGLSTDRNDGTFLATVVTSEMFGDSDVAMGCLASAEDFSLLDCETEAETFLSGTAPMRSLLLLTWLDRGAARVSTPSELSSAFVKG